MILKGWHVSSRLEKSSKKGLTSIKYVFYKLMRDYICFIHVFSHFHFWETITRWWWVSPFIFDISAQSHDSGIHNYGYTDSMMRYVFSDDFYFYWIFCRINLLFGNSASPIKYIYCPTFDLNFSLELFYNQIIQFFRIRFFCQSQSHRGKLKWDESSPCVIRAKWPSGRRTNFRTLQKKHAQKNFVL